MSTESLEIPSPLPLVVKKQTESSDNNLVTPLQNMPQNFRTAVLDEVQTLLKAVLN